MKSLTVLTDEHRIIDRMLEVLVEVANRLEQRREIAPAVAEGVLRFFRLIADGVHHEKEERVLFPVLVRHDFGPDQPFINALMEHHEMGRMYVQRMETQWVRLQQGDAQARGLFVSEVRAYVDLMREHIRIEDDFFRGQAAECLSAADHEELAAGFEAIETRKRLDGWPGRYRDDIATYHRLLRDA